jgi:multicomponent Na+:H+ antiporter subunit D
VTGPFLFLPALLESVAAIPPALVVALAALAALVLPRRAGHAVATVALLAVAGWALSVPDGVGTTATFLGFDVLVIAVDDVSRLMTLIFAGFGAAAVAYASQTDAGRTHLAAALGYVAAALWAVLAGDWLGLLVGWEAMAILSTALVWLSGGDAVSAGYRYALAHGIGGSLLAAGIALHLLAVGPAEGALHFDGTGVSAGIPTLVFGVGIAINAAVIGFHAWMPDTYPRPHVATSVFLCAYTTKTAVYAAHRAFPEGNLVLAYVGGAMAVYGAAYALAQKDMRRLLTYHIQAQVGFMLAGIGIGSALGIAGGFGHLLNNVLYKGLLFMVAGVIVLHTGKNKLDGFGALRTTAPVTLAVFLVAALSITAVPGFNGFVSKGMIVDAAIEDGRTVLEWLLYVGSVGTFASFVKFGHYAFLKGEEGEMADAGVGHAAVMLALAAACVVLGVLYQVQFALLPATGTWTTDPYTATHVLKAAAFLTAGLLVFRLADPVLARLSGGIDVDRLHDPLAFYGTRGLSGAVGSLFRSVDALAVAAASAVVGAVKDPGGTLSALVPDRWEPRYRERRARTPGATGTKLGIEGTITVAVAVLTLTLATAYVAISL